MPSGPPRWVFDRLPPSGARRGGDPSEHAFDAKLATFVREVIQNANDQALDPATRRSVVRFDHFELSGRELEDFRQAIDAENLFSHIKAASETSAKNLEEALSDARSKLSILRITDGYTSGLAGGEDDEKSHFRALCKDTLISFKGGKLAGGSYGLGKSVLWSFSSLSTVLFSSTFREKGADRFRLLGRTEIPSHIVGQRGYSGSGWFGIHRCVTEGERAESVWDKAALKIAPRLKLSREPGTSGTSIIVVGFRDPATDAETSEEQILAEIRLAARRYFWPALTWPSAPLEVFVQGEPVVAGNHESSKCFVECWSQVLESSPSRISTNSCSVHDISIQLPRRRNATKGVRVCAKLSIKIGEEGKEWGPPETAVFRGPGMIVEHWTPKDLRAPRRPFKAILACGLARNPVEPTPEDREFEEFLRSCEPPGHDTWQATQAVKNEYIKGYGKALRDLRSQVDELLRKTVQGEESHCSEAPAHIRRLFPLFSKGAGGGGTRSAFTIFGLQAELNEGTWTFDGTIRATSPGRAWMAQIKLFEVDGDGKPLGDPVLISTVEGPLGGTYEVRDGVAIIRGEHRTRELSFMGESVALPASEETRGAICIEVNARVEKGES